MYMCSRIKNLEVWGWETSGQVLGRFCCPSLQLMQLILWSCRDLYRIATFLSEEGYKADITDCRRRFPGLLTFCEFLELSRWADATRTYADGFDY